LLVKETPDHVGEVFGELPQMLLDRINAYPPRELWLQATESQSELIENALGEIMDPALAVLPGTKCHGIKP
jgi:magnesium transporter